MFPTVQLFHGRKLLLAHLSGFGAELRDADRGQGRQDRQFSFIVGTPASEADSKSADRRFARPRGSAKHTA